MEKVKLSARLGLVAVAVLVLAVHARELVGGHVPASAELLLDAMPKAQLVQEALARGGLPFWTDRLFLGYPLLGSGETGLLEPLTWCVHHLACALRLDARATVLLDLVLHHGLFALLVYALAGTLYRSTVTRFAVTAALALSGFTLHHAASGAVMRALPYLPLLCLLAPAGELALSALAVAGLFLAGDPGMAAVVVTGWTLYVLAHQLDGAGGALARTAGRCGPPLLIGLGIAACQVYPQLETMRQSAETLSTGQSLAPAAWASWVLPSLHGEAAQTAGFVGVAPLLCALCGWGLVPGALRRFALLAGAATLAVNLMEPPVPATAFVALLELAIVLAYGHVLEALGPATLAGRWRAIARQAAVAGLALALVSVGTGSRPLRSAAGGVFTSGVVAGLAARAAASPPWVAALACADSVLRHALHARRTLPPPARGSSAPAALAEVAPGARVFVRLAGLDTRLHHLLAAGAGNGAVSAGLGAVGAVGRYPPAAWSRFFGHEHSATLSPGDDLRFDLANVTHMIARQNFRDLQRASVAIGGFGYARAGALGWAYFAVPGAAPVGALPTVRLQASDRPVVTATAIRAPGVVVERHEEGRLDVRTRTARSGWLVTAIGNAPGWEATLDGEPAPIATANGWPARVSEANGPCRVRSAGHDDPPPALTGAENPHAAGLMALALSPGEHAVSFTYVPRTFRSGLEMSFACLILLAVAVGLRRRI